MRAMRYRQDSVVHRSRPTRREPGRVIDNTPETVLAADGETVLRRFRVEGVIYAPDRKTAQRRVNGTRVCLDSVRLLEEDERAFCSHPDCIDPTDPHISHGDH